MTICSSQRHKGVAASPTKSKWETRGGWKTRVSVAKRQQPNQSLPPEFNYDQLTIKQIVEPIRRQPKLKAHLPLTHLSYVDRALDKECDEYPYDRHNPPPPQAGATLADVDEDVVHRRTVRNVDVTRAGTQAIVSAGTATTASGSSESEIDVIRCVCVC